MLLSSFSLCIHTSYQNPSGTLPLLRWKMSKLFSTMSREMHVRCLKGHCHKHNLMTVWYQGYWLCHSLSEWIRDVIWKRFRISKWQVYFTDVTFVAVLFILPLLAMFLFIYVIKQQILVFKFYGKSKLLETRLNKLFSS